MAETERTCDTCGRSFKSDGAWYAKHALSCKGKPATSGRVVSPGANKRSKRGHAERTPPAAKRSAAVSRKSPFAAAIAELETKRAAALTEADACASAIAALEALA